MTGRTRVLVIGRRGVLASALARIAAPELDLRFIARPDIDLASPVTLQRSLGSAAPDLVINAAAVSGRAEAEADRRRALAVNARGAGLLAAVAAEAGAALVHLSTAEVFDGTKTGAYRECDTPRPINTLGATKLLGEELALQANPRTAVLRTSWLVPVACPPAEISWIRDSGDQDPTGSPTLVEDMAQLCIWLAPRFAAAPEGDPVWGITHVAGRGACALSEFRRAAGLPTVERRAPVPVPGNAVLDCSRLTSLLGYRLPHWRESLGARTRAPLAEPA